MAMTPTISPSTRTCRASSAPRGNPFARLLRSPAEALLPLSCSFCSLALLLSSFCSPAEALTAAELAQFNNSGCGVKYGVCGGEVLHGFVSASVSDGVLALSRGIGDFELKGRYTNPQACRVTAWPDVTETQLGQP